MSTDRWMDIEDVIHTRTHTHTHTHEHYSAIKKKYQNLVICDNMDGTRGYYAKWNKSDRNTNTIWPHLYVESKKLNKQNKNRLIDTETKKVVARGRRVSEIGEGD